MSIQVIVIFVANGGMSTRWNACIFFFFARNIFIAGSTWTSKFIKKILASAAVTFCLASCTLPSSDHKLQNNRCHKYAITLQINRCLHIFKKTEMVLTIAKIAKFVQNDSNNPKFVYNQLQVLFDCCWDTKTIKISRKVKIKLCIHRLQIYRLNGEICMIKKCFNQKLHVWV